MLGWLYRRITDGLIENVMDWIESKEGQEYLNEVVDTIVDRQVSRIQGSIGGSLKGSKGGGGFSSGNIWMALIQAFLNKQSLNSSVPNELGSKGNPYG